MSLDSLVSVVHVTLGAAMTLTAVAALILAKGSRAHRLAGALFFAAMASMVLTASVLSLMRPDIRGNVLGFLTLYLTVTGWWTARNRVGGAGRFEIGAAVAAGLVAVLSFYYGYVGMTDPVSSKDAMFAPVSHFIGGLALLFGVMDLSVYFRGGVQGPKRFTRHAWRMGLAAFFATAAGFIGQMERFPDAMQRVIPYGVLAMLAVVLFWIVRVRFTRWRMRAV